MAVTNNPPYPSNNTPNAPNYLETARGTFVLDNSGNPSGSQSNPFYTSSSTIAESTAGQFSAFGEQLTAEKNLIAALLFPYNINSNIVSTTTTGSGTITQANSMAVLQTSANTNSTAILYSNRLIEYRPGEGVTVLFTGVFTAGVAGSKQYLGIGDQNSEDGFFFGYNGTDFSILHRNNSNDTWIPQSEWNIDTADGTGNLPNDLDFTKGNVFKISFQWLGFGAIEFFIENPSTGRFELVHIIRYSNTSTVPSLSNPTLPLSAFVENTTNDTNITLSTPSMGGYIEGRNVPVGYIYGTQNTKSGIGTTLTNLFTIRNKSTFAGKNNRVVLQLYFTGSGADGNKTVQVFYIMGATLGGSPSYSDIDTNGSVVDVDTAGTTVTGGRTLAVVELGKTGSIDINIKDYEFYLEPGQTFTIAAQTVDTGSSEVSASLTWFERL